MNENKIYSVVEFLEAVNNVFMVDFDMVTIQGEVSDLKLSQGKWIWFTLKDEHAAMDCFLTLWQLNGMRMAPSRPSLDYQHGKSPDLPIENGMEIRATGFPTVFSRSGKFTFKPQYIETVGEGAWQKQFDLLYKKLESEGLFLSERKRQLPKFPQRIGLITSREAAAYSDFLKILTTRWPHVSIDFYHVSVQGADAVGEIVLAFEYFNDLSSQNTPIPEVLVLTRGGGSFEDLMVFNSEDIARAVYGSRIPVLCAIGHERDITIAELVADCRASTPSHASEILVPNQKNISRELDHHIFSIFSMIESSFEQYTFSLANVFHGLNRAFEKKFSRYKNFEKELLAHLIALEGKIAYNIGQTKWQQQRLLSFFEKKFSEVSWRLELRLKLLGSFSPKNVLRRGFTLSKDKSGKIINSNTLLRSGDIMVTEFHDGELESRVL